MFTSVEAALKYIKDNRIAMVDLKIVGLFGQWLHLTIPARQVAAKHFAEGVGYDGSSGSGFTTVEAGDVNALPRPETAFLDPFWDQPTLSFLCDTITADTHEPFPADPRTIARKAVEYMRTTGIADDAWMGPEFEFHVFDRVEVRHEPYDTRIKIASSEITPQGLTPAIPRKGGYFRVPPAEHFHDLRSEIALTLEGMGIPVRYHHHEVGASGQCEIEVDLQPLVRAADQAMIIKYVVKNLARKHGRLATFMPKPVFGEAGNGMHVHQKLTKGAIAGADSRSGSPGSRAAGAESSSPYIFFDERRKNYANLSDLGLSYVSGLLQHGAALTALTNPSTNSYKRLVEGYEAPVNLFFSLGNRSAAVRVPKYAVSPEDKRIEYRPPDFTCNVYVALAAMLLAGLDGVRQKLVPADHHFGPFDVDIAKQDRDFRARIGSVPGSLADALAALERGHEFLLRGGVFSAGFIRHWVDIKQASDVRPVAIQPHPYEYAMYLDA